MDTSLNNQMEVLMNLNCDNGMHETLCKMTLVNLIQYISHYKKKHKIHEDTHTEEGETMKWMMMKEMQMSHTRLDFDIDHSYYE